MVETEDGQIRSAATGLRQIMELMERGIDNGTISPGLHDAILEQVRFVGKEYGILQDATIKAMENMRNVQGDINEFKSRYRRKFRHLRERMRKLQAQQRGEGL